MDMRRMKNPEIVRSGVGRFRRPVLAATLSIGLAVSGLSAFAVLSADASAVAAPPASSAHAVLAAGAVADVPHPAQCSPGETRATERYWYFGDGAAVDFGVTGSSAEPFAGSDVSSGEGTTVATDSSGKLQFWSNANTIYDRTGAAMENGTGLLGNYSAVQTVAAFPAVGQPGKYFSVTTDGSVFYNPNGKLTYSVIDMNLNGGLGAVTSTKNVQLGESNTASEALTAVPNAAGTGFWVVTQTANSSNVLAYEFGADGPITGTAVVSEMSAGNLARQGSIYFNADLTQAVSMGGDQTTANLRVLDFNALTGQFTENLAWSIDGASTLYTADFSPAGDYVYVSEFGNNSHLFRFRIAGATTGAEVSASKEDLGLISSVQGGHVRRAPDGKMYVANQGLPTLSVVNDPDSATDPMFVPESFALAAGTSSTYGLPQMVTGCPPALDEIRHLSLAKTATPESGVHAGDVVTYTVTAVNDGEADYTAEHPAQIVDDMTGVLDDATYNGDAKAVASDGSEIPSPSYASPKLGWSGPLAVGASVTITYTMTVTGLGDLSMLNSAAPVCTTSEICEPPTVVVVLLPRVTPSKTSDPVSGTNVSAGDVVTYTLSWKNDGLASGPLDSTDDLSDVLDDGALTSPPVVDAAHTDTVTAKLEGKAIRVTGNLAPGETTTVTYQVTVGADGTRGNNEAVNVLTPDVPPYVPPTGCTEGAPNCPGPFIPPTTEHNVSELHAWKTVNPASGTSLVAGQDVTYTLHFTNTGAAPATVDRADDLSQVLDDATMTKVPVSSDAALVVSEVAADNRFTIAGSVKPGASVTVAYTVTVKAEGDRGDDILANFLLKRTDPPITTPDCTPTAGEEPDCTTNPVGNLAVTKSVDPSSGTTVVPGQQLDYTLTFINTGKGTSMVDYTDVIAGVLDDATITAAPKASNTALTASAITDGEFTIAGELAPGQKVAVSYSVTVKVHAEQGDHSLGNFLQPTGVTPPITCVEDNPLCTVNHVLPPAGAGLASTGVGAELPIAGGIGLLLAGLVVLLVRRRNRGKLNEEEDVAALV